jgi:hypothetical protein
VEPVALPILKHVITSPLYIGGFQDLSILNTSYELEDYVPAALNTAGDQQFVTASITVSDDITYLTTSINQGFAGQPVFFDIIADFEVTPK